MHEVWIDRWKGVLILLVVLGHVAGGGENLWLFGGVGCTSVLGLIREVIYAFHMPAFFLLAGMCWRTRGDWLQFLQKKAFRLVVPYLVFAVLSWLVFDVIYGTWRDVGWQFLSIVHGGNWPDGEGFKCNSVLWFPPVMFVVLVGYRMIEVGLTAKALHGAVSCGILWKSVICLMLWFLRVLCYRYRVLFLPGGVDLALWYLPYFIIGTMVGGSLRSVKTWKLGAMAFACFIGVWMVRIYFPPYRLASFKGFSYAIALALSGSCLSLAIAKSHLWGVHCFDGCGKALANIGRASMGIMLIHKFPVVALQERVGVICKMFTDNIYMALSGMMLVTVASTTIGYVGTLLLRRFLPFAIGERRGSAT